MISTCQTIWAEIKLIQKSLLNDMIQIKVPDNFNQMSEDLLNIKYPSSQRPTFVLSDETGGINVAFNHTTNNANQNVIEAYKDNFVKTFKNIYPSAKWKSSGVKEVNGKKIGYLELVTPAIDTKIYNLIFFTDCNGKLLLCTFNCTQKSIKKWSHIAMQIMESLKIK